MKKILLLAGILALAMSTQAFAEETLSLIQDFLNDAKNLKKVIEND